MLTRILAMFRWRRLLHRKFKPCVVYNDHMNLTEMVLEDVPTVWTLWRCTSHMGHTVDLGYAMDDGRLVAVRIWDDVRRRTKG